MEDTLRVVVANGGKTQESVLILVLMEDTLRVHKVMQIANNFSES